MALVILHHMHACTWMQIWVPSIMHHGPFIWYTYNWMILIFINPYGHVSCSIIYNAPLTRRLVRHKGPFAKCSERLSEKLKILTSSFAVN